MLTASLVLATALAAQPGLAVSTLAVMQNKPADPAAEKTRNDDPLGMFPVIPRRLNVRAKPPANLEDGFKVLNAALGDAVLRARTPADKLLLAGRIAHFGIEKYDDSATCWVAFRESIRLAGESGNPFAVFRAFAIADQLFEFDMVQERFQTLRDMAKNGAQAPPAVQQVIAKAALYAAREAEGQARTPDDYTKIGELIDLAFQVAVRIKDSATKDMAVRFRNELKKSKAEFETALEARTALISSPDDIEANLVWGKQLCFRKGDWNSGLPVLAKGVGTTLGELARDDLAVKRRDYASRPALGDRWWALADADRKAPARDIEAMRLRAAWWYVKSEDFSNSDMKLAKARVNQMRQAMELASDTFSENDLKEGMKVQYFTFKDGVATPEFDEVSLFEGWQPKAEHHALIAGYIKIDAAAEFTFRDLTNSNGCDLYVGGTRVLSQMKDTGSHRYASPTVNLVRGVVPFKLYVYAGRRIQLHIKQGELGVKPVFLYNPNIWPSSFDTWQPPSHIR